MFSFGQVVFIHVCWEDNRNQVVPNMEEGTSCTKLTKVHHLQNKSCGEKRSKAEDFPTRVEQRKLNFPYFICKFDDFYEYWWTKSYFIFWLVKKPTNYWCQIYIQVKNFECKTRLNPVFNQINNNKTISSSHFFTKSQAALHSSWFK